MLEESCRLVFKNMLKIDVPFYLLHAVYRMWIRVSRILRCITITACWVDLFAIYVAVTTENGFTLVVCSSVIPYVYDVSTTPTWNLNQDVSSRLPCRRTCLLVEALFGTCEIDTYCCGIWQNKSRSKE